MFFKLFSIFVLAFCGFINCGGGGGGDPKVTPPPPPVTYTATLNPSQGIIVNPPSATGQSGETKVFSITLPLGYTNPVANPAGSGTFSNGLVAGSYNFTVVLTANMVINISATPPVSLYSVSGKVVRNGGFNATFGVGATVTLSTGQSMVTDAEGNYTFAGVATGNYVVNIVLFGWVFDPSFRNVGVNNADSTGNNFTATMVNPTVEMSINVFYKDSVITGTTTCLVEGASLVPLTAGMTFSCWVQKPGESDYTFLQYSVVEPSSAGMYTSIQLYYGEGFFDTLPDGTKRYWNSGIATYKVEITSPTGVKTSVIAKVGVLMGSGLHFGPLQQVVVSPDKKSIQLIGSFPTAPVAKLYKFIPYPIRLSWTVVPNNFIVSVPPGFSSADSQLVVIAGYPNAECSTVKVDLVP